uniref:beta-ketoacyl synthase N-terminal-like domain-containing protein n=1 Tax=Desulfovibrio sp. TaxID=885 RepID=UPI0026052284
CSSVLAALHQACRSLHEGECAVALVGGAHVIDLPVKADAPFAIESASGRTRTFDAGAEGVGAGEGAAVFLLKPLDAALRDHDAIHAVIPGSAVNQDGKSSSMAAPNPEAQAEIIDRAARNAGVSLADIHFFEAHGTATVLGDPVEIEGLRRAFARQGARREQKALIGSVKGNLGHLDAAAGAAGLAKAVLCLENGLVPPQPHFERPNPHIDFEAAPVRVAQMLEPLPPQERPWRCGVSSFGLSGVNTHVIVAEHQAQPLPQDDGHWQCVVFSAPDETSLQDYARAVAAAVARNEGWPLHAIASTLMTGRDALPVRAALVARSRQELLEQLEAGLTGVAAGNAARHDSRSSMENPLPGAFFASQEAAQAAASAYLAGARIAWPAEKPVYRVHLPAAPLAAATLWPRFAAHFLSEPVITPAGKAFALAVDRPDFWPAAEHRLEGTPLLVGMSLLDCLGWIGGAAPLSLHDLRWRKPVTCGPGRRVVLLAQEQGDALAVELHHFEPATHNVGGVSTTGQTTGTWSVAASGLVRGGTARPAALNLATARESLREMVQQDTPEDSPLMVSGRWQCRKALWVAEDGNTLLAELCLPEAYRADFNTFRWHPAMMDIAASLALRGAYGFVPAGCRMARLHSPLTAQAFALVRITDRQQGMIVADCAVTDASGQIVAELEGMTFMALRKGQAVGKSGPDTPQMHPLHGDLPQPELYAIGWKQADLKGRAVGPQNIMLVGGQGGLLSEALEPLAHAHRPLPLQADEIRTLAREILAGPTDHLLWLPASQSAGQHCGQNGTWPLCALLQEICSGGLRRPLRVTVVGSGAFVPDTPAHEPHQACLPQGALYMGPLLCLPWEEPRIFCAYVEL